MNTILTKKFHLSAEIILEIHTEAIAWFGGLDVVMDMEALKVALAKLQQDFTDDVDEASIIGESAAYLYLCRNHLFIDSNKRTALCACITHLRLNGIQPKVDGPEWKRLTKSVDSGMLTLEETTQALRELLVL